MAILPDKIKADDYNLQQSIIAFFEMPVDQKNQMVNRLENH
jgi:hypothetical protein